MTGPAEGVSRHGPPCTLGEGGRPCHRCAGFQSGHELATKHGAYSIVKVSERAAELAADLGPLVPGYCSSDEPAVRLLAIMLARVERAEAALEEAGPADLQRLRQDALGWANASRRMMNDLGMTPTARARMGLDVARAKGAALAAHVADRYGEAG